MIDVQIQRLDEVEPYTGPHALEGIRFRPLGRAIGVTAWGMNVLALGGTPGKAYAPRE